MAATGNARSDRWPVTGPSATARRAGLLEHHGLAPVERFVQVSAPAARLRVQEAGSGPRSCSSTAPAGSAYFAPLVRELRSFGAWSSTGPAGG